MKILRRYVFSSFLSAFWLTLMVLSFVLSVGLLVKATELVVKGLDPRLVLRFLAVGLPESMTFTVPLALLVSALLVFGRLSADGEIGAMKACGVNLWGIMRPPIYFGLLMTGLCVLINNEVSPRSHEMRRDLTAMVGVGAGLKLLEPGRFIQEFPGMTFWFARREGDRLREVLIFDKSRAGKNREIRADSARIVVAGDDLRLELYQVRVDPFYEDRPGAATAASLAHLIPGAMKRRDYTRGMKDFGLSELLRTIRGNDATNALEQRAASVDAAAVAAAQAASTNGVVAVTASGPMAVSERTLAVRERVRQTSIMRFELHRRFSLAAAAFCFVLLGMPLGIRAQRRESTIGIALSLGITLFYYIFVIAADSLASRPEMRAHLLAWLPAVACLFLAAWLVRRNQ